MTGDERMWNAGFMPPWIKKEISHLLRPMELPHWIGGEKEEWRPFRDGTYDISSFGNVRRAKAGIGTFAGRPLLSGTSGSGYAQACLALRGEAVRLYIHRMVAEAFIRPCPDGFVVNHIDGNKANNRLANLEYVSPRDNCLHALATTPRRKGPTKPRMPLRGPQRGESHWTKRRPELIARGERMGASKLKEEQVREILLRLAAGERQSSLAKEFHVSVAQMSRIARGTRWSHMGEK